MTAKTLTIWLTKVAVSALLLFLLFSNADLEGFVGSFGDLGLTSFVLALLVSAIGILARAHKWQLLLGVQGINMSLQRAHSLTYMSIFFNNLFLGALGGDGFRVLKTHRQTASRSGALSAVLYDRLTGFAALALVVLVAATVSVGIHSSLLPTNLAIQVAAVSAAGLVVSYLFVLLFENLEQIDLLRRHPYASRLVKDLVDSARVHRKHSNTLIRVMLLAFAYQVLAIISMDFYVLTAGARVSILELSVIVPVVSLVIMVPISINGIGVQEGAFYYFFHLVGVDSATALLISLLPRIGMLLISLVGAVLYLTERGYDEPGQGRTG